MHSAIQRDIWHFINNALIFPSFVSCRSDIEVKWSECDTMTAYCDSRLLFITMSVQPPTVSVMDVRVHCIALSTAKHFLHLWYISVQDITPGCYRWSTVGNWQNWYRREKTPAKIRTKHAPWRNKPTTPSEISSLLRCFKSEMLVSGAHIYFCQSSSAALRKTVIISFCVACLQLESSTASVWRNYEVETTWHFVRWVLL